MVRVAVGAVALAISLAASPAWAEEAPSAPSSEPASEVPPPADESSDWASVLGVFDALVTHYIELMEFTKRVEAEREERDFEQAAEQYSRFDEFTRALAAQREQELEREFEASVALYVQKISFTRDLAAKRERTDGSQVEGSK